MKLLYCLTSLTAVLAAAVIPPEARTQVKELIEELAEWDLGRASVIDERPTPQEADDEKAEDHPTITSRPTRSRPRIPLSARVPVPAARAGRASTETVTKPDSDKSTRNLGIGRKIQPVFMRLPPRFG